MSGHDRDDAGDRDRAPTESEALVAATDLGVAIVALAMLRDVLEEPHDPGDLRGRALRRGFGAFFGAVAVASFAGAAVHGLYRDATSPARRAQWRLSLAAVGVSAAAGVHLAAALALDGAAAAVARRASLVVLAGWVALLAIATVPYRAAVALYLPSIAAFGVALGTRLAVPAERRAAALGLVGLGATVAAAIVQVVGVRVGPLGRNTLYHAIQAVGLGVSGRAAVAFVGRPTAASARGRGVGRE